MTSTPRTMLRHARPRTSWTAGASRMLRDSIRSTSLDEAMLMAIGLAVAAFVLAMVSYAIEIVWHPLFYVAPTIVAAIVANRLSYDVYERAERVDAEIHRAGIDMVARDSALPIGESVLFATDGIRDRYLAMDARGDPSGDATFRRTTMRLAALLADHRESTEPDDAAARLETARAAEAILAEAEHEATGRVPVRMEEAARTKPRPPRIVGEILGHSVATFASPGARTGDERADAMIMIAEEALVDEPDLADAVGARIDSLVRQHLPGLVSTRDAAIRHADATAIEDARRLFEKGLERIRSSLEEALQASQRARTDELAAQVRFLGMRRGEEIDADDREHAPAIGTNAADGRRGRGGRAFDALLGRKGR